MRRSARINLIQNIVIVLLSVSAVGLFVRTQLLSRESGQGYFTTLLTSGDTGEGDARPAKLTELAAPIRFAATGAYGRWGSDTLTTTDEEFAAPGALLREALGSAASPASCPEKDFRAALDGLSVYYDFRTVLPVAVAEGLAGAQSDVLTGGVRRVVLAADGERVVLYLTDGSSFLRCATRVSREDLAALVGTYELGGASFACELEDGAELEPYSLLLTGEQAAYPLLTAETVSGGESAILTALGFNPRTNSRYTEPGGEEVIMDDARTIRFGQDGTLRYESGGVLTERITAAGDVPTAEEAVTGSCRLLNALLNGQSGDAALYLSGAENAGDVWTLTFDYRVGGVPVLRDSGVHAAVVCLEGAGVQSLSLAPRRYTAGGETSLLLPLTQALAVASLHPGCELGIFYSDGGSGEISAVWLAG